MHGGGGRRVLLRRKILDAGDEFVEADDRRGAGGLQQRHLQHRAAGEGEAGLVGGRGEDFDDAQQFFAVAERGLGLEGVELGGRHVEGGRHLGGVGADEQVAEVGEEFLEQALEVATGVVLPADFMEHGRGVALEDGLGEGCDGAPGGEAEDVEDVFLGDLLALEGDDLVERGFGVAQAAVGAAGDGEEGFVGDLPVFGFGDFAEAPGDFLEPDAAEVEALAAGEDGDGDLVDVGGREEELDVRGRLLEGLEEGVEGARGEHVDFVDDVDFVGAAGGGVAGVLAELADLVDVVVAGAVDFDDVEAVAGGDFAAGVALVAGFGAVAAVHAVEGLGEQAGGGGLAGAAGPDEDVGMGDAAGLDGAGQRLDDRLLAHDLVEFLRAPFSRQDFV